MGIERWLRTVPLQLRALIHPATTERDLDDELADHVDRLTEQLISRGRTGADARREALAAIGGIERRKQELREVRRSYPLENLRRDIRHAARSLRRRPLFAAIIILTLAIGAGINVAIFTIVNGVLLRPLPYAHPDQLVVIDHQSQGNAVPAELFEWHAAAPPAFDRIGAAVFHVATLTHTATPEQLPSLWVTSDVFPMLGVRPEFGRVFTPEEAHTGHTGVVILSHQFWLRHFGGDPHALGHTLMLDGVPHLVIGVMPASFRFAPYWATQNDIWVPLALDGQENDWNMAALRVFGRLRPGATSAEANREMQSIAAHTAQQYPDHDTRLVVVPLKDRVTRSVREELWALLGAVLIVLLIACANVSHLQLVRASARERESAVRLSLGAGRGRLVQQALVESLLLSLAGAALGLAFAEGAVRALLALAPANMPRLESIHIDIGVFVFLLLIVIGTGVASAVLPASAVSSIDPNQSLRSGGRGGETRARRRIGKLLVTSEFSLAVLLLIGAGLVLRSVSAMLSVDTVFNPAGVTSMVVALRGTQHGDPARRGGFFEELLPRLAAQPEVKSVGAINHLPLHGDSWRFGFHTEDHPLVPAREEPSAFFRLVLPGYFATMEIPMLRGRDIVAADVVQNARVVVVDQALADANWPGASPVGKRISVDDPATGAHWFTVIGEVRNVRQGSWSASRVPEMYYPFWSAPIVAPDGSFDNLLSQAAMTLVIRARPHALVTAAAVRRTVAALDPDVPVADVITMDAAVDEQVAEPRFYLVLLGAFAVVALILSAVGVYGVMSHIVASRARDIGIRVALGAGAGAPFRLVLVQGMQLALVGSAVGLAAAFLLTRYLRALLYQVGPTDLTVFISVPVVLLIVALAGCVVPALRASRVDPMQILRGE
jgi:predicted permease